jgi:NADH:ubiquinone reductase (H+-translocating)
VCPPAALAPTRTIGPVTPRVVIVGGGFAGTTLARALGERARVTLVSEVNYLLFTPMLAEVAAADVDPRHILVPLRQLCPRARVVIGEATAVDGVRRTVTVRSPIDGARQVHEADAVVLAAGGVTETFGVPGVEEHALSFKTISDALRIRTRLLAFLEEATEVPDDLLTSVAIVGAGYSGAELAASLADFLRRARRRYYRGAPAPTVTLIDAVDRVVPMLPERSSAAAARALRRRGVDLALGVRVSAVEQGRVLLESGSTVVAGTIVWAGGVRGRPVAGAVGAEPNATDRFTVDERLRLADGVWALGDVALAPDGHGGWCPPTAQHAMRQGAYLGRHLPAMIGGGATPRFSYSSKGELVALGHRNAVGTVLGVRVRGFLAWFLWRSYYLKRLPTLGRKARVALDWALDLVFPPDVADPATADRGPRLRRRE